MYFLNENLLSFYLSNLNFIMIDYLIFYLKKEIWTNFESYEFSNFYGFLEFFRIYFGFIWIFN